MKVGAVIVCAGRGKRIGRRNKAFISLGGRPLFTYSLKVFGQIEQIKQIVLVFRKDNLKLAKKFAGKRVSLIEGGRQRKDSVYKGLMALNKDLDYVLVHDAARPLPSAALLADVFDTAEQFGAAVPGVPVMDTIKRVDEEGKVVDTLERSRLRAVQTPQVARRDWFDQAIAGEADRLHLYTDDASLLEAAGFPVHISRGDVMNRKITTSEDMIWLQMQLEAGA